MTSQRSQFIVHFNPADISDPNAFLEPLRTQLASLIRARPLSERVNLDRVWSGSTAVISVKRTQPSPPAEVKEAPVLSEPQREFQSAQQRLNELTAEHDQKMQDVKELEHSKLTADHEEKAKRARDIEDKLRKTITDALKDVCGRVVNEIGAQQETVNRLARELADAERTVDELVDRRMLMLNRARVQLKTLEDAQAVLQDGVDNTPAGRQLLLSSLRDVGRVVGGSDVMADVGEAFSVFDRDTQAEKVRSRVPAVPDPDVQALKSGCARLKEQIASNSVLVNRARERAEEERRRLGDIKRRNEALQFVSSRWQEIVCGQDGKDDMKAVLDAAKAFKLTAVEMSGAAVLESLSSQQSPLLNSLKAFTAVMQDHSLVRAQVPRAMVMVVLDTARSQLGAGMTWKKFQEQKLKTVELELPSEQMCRKLVDLGHAVEHCPQLAEWRVPLSVWHSNREGVMELVQSVRDAVDENVWREGWKETQADSLLSGGDWGALKLLWDEGGGVGEDVRGTDTESEGERDVSSQGSSKRRRR